MKILKMFLENIYSYEKMEFSFDNFPGGTTLLLGKNLDQKTSNGSGKSSILKSLYYGLYGEDVNGAVKSAILRRGSTGSLIVVEFEDKGHFYKIERFEGRKDKSTSGKGLNFYIDNELFNGEGIEQTQKFINQKIKITPRLFLSSIYAAQDSNSNFLLESDTNKKELLTELLDLSVYQKAFVHVKKEIEEMENSISDNEKKIDGLKEQIKNLDDQVKEFIKKRDSFNFEIKLEVQKEIEKGKAIALKIEEVKSKIIPKYNLDEIKSNIDSINKRKEELESEIKKDSLVKVEIEKISSNILQIKNKNEEIEKELNEIKIENLALEEIKFDESQLNSYIKNQELLESQLIEIESLKKEYEALKIEIETKTISNTFLIKELDQLKQSKTDLIEGTSCPTCKREYNQDEKHKNHVKNEVLKIEESLLEKEKEINNIHNFLIKGNENLNKISEKTNKESEIKESLSKVQNDIFNSKLIIEKVKAKDREIEKNNKKVEDLLKTKEKNFEINNNLIFKLEEIKKKDIVIESFKKDIVSLEEKIKSLNKLQLAAEVEKSKIKQDTEYLESLQKDRLEKIDKINSLRKKENPYGEMIVNIEKRTVEFFEKIDLLNKKNKNLNEELKYLKFWQIGFAPTGIRSFITDDVIDLLNRKTQENLNDLFDGALSVFFDPESKNKKGVVSNKISTHFFLNGKETVKETLSGGELRRAILATELALTEIAESRSGNKLNVRFLDEPFNGIDSNGQLQTFKLFSRLSRDKDGFFVISHDENFQNMCSNVIYVLKKNEISKLVSKEAYDKANIKSDEKNIEEVEQENVLEVKDKKDILAEKLKQLSKK